MSDEPRFARISTNGVTLNVVEAGPLDGPLAILLHGFPESWYGWRHLIAPLAEAGYRVLAPDQRGYGASDKPRGVAAYALDILADDVVGLVDASGRERATVIGHDWGGVVAWGAISRHPTRFDRAVILNAPHPDAMLREIKGNLGQFLKSWYILFFQLPGLPEMLLRRHDFRRLVDGMTHSSRPGTFSTADFERYKAGWAEPGALTAMVDWYRAGLRIKHDPFPDPLVQVPTLLIWGTRDRFVVPGVARSSYALCESARLEWLDEASHWVQHEEPEKVNRLIIDFLGSSLVRPSAS
jgi:epoxide hydrolase 4